MRLAGERHQSILSEYLDRRLVDEDAQPQPPIIERDGRTESWGEAASRP